MKIKINRTVTVLILIGLLIFISYSKTGIAEKGFKKFRGSSKQMVEDEVLVKFSNTSSIQSVTDTIVLLGDTSIKKIESKNYMLVKLEHGKDIESAISQYENMPNVEYAQPNYIYRAMSTVPNDTYYSNLWGLKNTGQTIANPSYNTNNPGTFGMDMDMELAWDHVNDCDSVILAVLDSGINYNHEDLYGNMWNGATYHGYDFVDDDNDPLDLHGHGTHCAGTIGAMGNNNIGTTGVCWNIQIMAVRVLSAAGWGTTADIISGIYYAVNNGVKIISMSIGGSYFDQAYYDAIEFAGDNGVIVVAAAGNENVNNDITAHTYPCDFDLDNIIGVAALDQSYELANFSNYGSVSVDVGAPGTNIQSEWCGTDTYITDPLTGGWTEGGTLGWAYVVRDLGYGNENLLADPSNWGPPAWGMYSNNADDKIWKTFNIAGYDVAILGYWTWFDVESGYDAVFTYCDNGTSDPFINGVMLAGWTGSTGGDWVQEEYEIPSFCISSTCTVGFNLWSDFMIPSYGMGIVGFSISALSLNNNSYTIINGTSMATPHVAGLAALIWTFNPEYTYEEVIESVKNGGESVSSLTNKTTTGRAVNAWGSLKYIKPPTGVSIEKN